MLAGVNANDLEALLEFVYRGEVSVDHSQLPSLLQAAHCLNIQGLAPQTTVQKDDSASYQSIQLHPIVTQPHQMKTVVDVGGQHFTTDDQLITVQATPVQVQSEIVEEMADHLPEEMSKDMINQFLPQRKRKPRVKREGGPIKIQRMDDPLAGNTVTVTTTAAGNQSQQQIQVQSVQTVENGLSVTQIKQEKADLNVSGSSNSSQTIKVDAQGNPIPSSKRKLLIYSLIYYFGSKIFSFTLFS